MMALPFNRAHGDAAATYVLFGKLPSRADFVRINATHPMAQELDLVIQQAFESLINQPDWLSAYDNLAPVDIYYVSRDNRWVFVGVLTPSHDQSGRRYPLIAGAVLPVEAVDGRAHLAPIAYEVFFDGLREQATNAVENSVEALACRQFLESQLRANDTAAADLTLASSVTERFFATAPASRLNDLLIAQPTYSSLEQALLNIAFYRGFLRRFDGPATRQPIVLPLPSAKGEEPLIASAWLALLSAVWKGDAAHPWRGIFFVLRSQTGRAYLVTAFGSLAAEYTSLLLGGAAPQSALLDLANEQDAWRNHRLYAEVSYALSRLLSDPKLTVSSLQAFLSDIGHQLALAA